MNEPNTARHQPTAAAAPAYASLVLRHAGGTMVAPLSSARAITVGRRLPADVIIDDRSLALQHARFSLAGDGLSVEDLGSRSGTWVAGQSIKCVQLSSGQSVRLGNVTATVHVAPPRKLPAEGSASVIEGEHTRAFHELLRQVAATELCVLIEGESGVGKRFAAGLLHDRSGRRGALGEVDCRVASPFMPEPGAAQSALERAHGGSLFLAHVGSLSAQDQAALLHLLQTGRPAANAPRVDVRVIAADTRELGELVSEGAFDADLRLRLSALTLRLPPLRERRDEIERLVSQCLAEVARTWGRAPREIAPSVMLRLKELPWPGNITELKRAIEHADLVCGGARIELHDLPRELVLAAAASPCMAYAGKTAARVLPPSEAEASRAGLDFKGRVREYEIRMIVDALRRTGGNQRATARLLRIPLRTLAHKIKAFRIKSRLARELAVEQGVSG